MIDIKQILKSIFSRKEMTREEKLNKYRSIVDYDVIKYLVRCFNGLHIEVLGDYEGSLFELMSSNKLQGWCWQTTETAAVFLKDDDYIERGNLYLGDENPNYYHSWICFNYGEDYILDPCLNILCKKEDYYDLFTPNVKGRVTAKEVKEELIKQVKEYKAKPIIVSEFDKILKIMMGDKEFNVYKEYKKNEVTVHAPEDVNTPLYRNGAGYKTEIEEDKIKKLTVHYYWIDC